MFDQATTDDCLKLIAMALTEDIGGPGLVAGVDCTTDSVVPAGAVATARFVSREAGVVCGLAVCKLLLEHFTDDLSMEIAVKDGETVEPGQTIATISGQARSILIVERTCLNFLGRLSGIATLTQKYVEQVAGTRARILDTRKTMPGWRSLEKWAVACGGGTNHRLGLFDAVLIKDNHLAFLVSEFPEATGRIQQAVKRARKFIFDNQTELPDGSETIVQLEVDTLEQLEIALATDVDIVLLDNMDAETLAQAVQRRDQISPKTLLEASGGVNLLTIAGIARSGVDRISVGALTHSATNFDIGLDWKID